MKKLFVLALVFQSFSLFSQTKQVYYVVAKPGVSLKPIQVLINPDETLTFDMQDNEFESFLNSQSIYQLRKEFDTPPNSDYLKRIYRLTISSNSSINNFLNREEIEFIEPAFEFNNLYIPNDYQDLIGHPLTQLDLIKAPLAWNVTSGNPDVFTGIIESTADTTHEDYINKIVEVIGDGISGYHGALVTGLVAAETDNGIGLSSIGFDTKMVLLTSTNNAIFLNDFRNLSLYPGVRVINRSAGNCTFSPAWDDLFREIWEDYGVVVVCASGNGPNAGSSCGSDGHGYMYPASYDNTLSIGAISHLFPIGTNDPLLGESNWKDVIPNLITNPTTTSSLNDKVDIFAPGFYIYTTRPNNSYGYSATDSAANGAGTSLASPIVAGTVALMFSVNPNLTPDEVRDILKSTADDISFIPQNAPYLSYLAPNTGRLNAYRAVLTAKCMADPTPGPDLAMQNSKEDTFVEPDTHTQHPWQSEDIWVRNQNDGQLIAVHQNPEYDANNPNFVYVRVTNNSCVTSSGNDQLKLYWAKANTSLNWPDYWNGSIDINGVSMGDEVGTMTIPSLGIGETKILEFEWDVPNPEDYVGINPNPWHFCLLARIESADDPMTFSEGEFITANVLNNNNIAWKNTTVVDIFPNSPTPISVGGVIAVGNPFSNQKTFTIELQPQQGETGKAIYDEAEVTITLDDILYNAWDNGGKTQQQVEEIKSKTIKVTGGTANLGNLTLEPNALGTAFVSFNFLTKELTDKRDYTYHIIQKDAQTGQIIGGETFEVRKQQRDSFSAEAGNDEEIEKNDSITLSAGTINESATYNWYDPQGDLIHTGTDLTITPQMTQTYKLEVVTDIDGFKDYDEVTITVNPYRIETLIPNPAVEQVTVNYLAGGASSAYLMVINTQTGSSDNYILDTTLSNTIITVSNYNTGLYNIILVCDGEIQNSKTLLKE